MQGGVRVPLGAIARVAQAAIERQLPAELSQVRQDPLMVLQGAQEALPEATAPGGEEASGQARVEVDALQEAQEEPQERLLHSKL